MEHFGLKDKRDGIVKVLLEKVSHLCTRLVIVVALALLTSCDVTWLSKFWHHVWSALLMRTTMAPPHNFVYICCLLDHCLQNDYRDRRTFVLKIVRHFLTQSCQLKLASWWCQIDSRQINPVPTISCLRLLVLFTF